MSQKPLDVVYVAAVTDEHVDYNGHMTEAAYAKIFASAAAQLFRTLDLEADYRRRTHCTMYTLETQIRYLNEARSGALLAVRFRLLGWTEKRLHIYFEMYEGERLLAAYQCISVHVWQENGVSPRSAPFTDHHQATFEGLCGAYESVPSPDWVGEALGLTRSS
jgi:acyl-CoA thioester hydrolase